MYEVKSKLGDHEGNSTFFDQQKKQIAYFLQKSISLSYHSSDHETMSLI